MRLSIQVAVSAEQLEAALPTVRDLAFVSDLQVTGEPGNYTVTFQATTADAARVVRNAIEWYQPEQDAQPDANPAGE